MVTADKIEAADASDATEQPERPVLLVCTVGGSPQPIATALRELRPDVVWFLVSDGKSGEGSRPQVEDEQIEYDKLRGVRGPGLKYAEGCPPTTKVLPIPADDPDRAYALCRAHLAAARSAYPGHHLIADYTGGTKSMTGALLMAAFAERGVEVQFMLGERRDLVQVKSGSEQPHRMAADFIMAEREFVAAEQAVDAYDYAAARRLLHELRGRLQRAGAKMPTSFRRRLEQALTWAGAMAQWDTFRHREAAQRARGSPWLERALETSQHLEALLALGERDQGKPGWDICADLWLNARRRGERGRYDDAIARLYRLLEAAAQAHILARYKLETGRLALTELPDSIRSSVFMKTDPKTGEPYAQLGLDHAMKFLLARDPNDEFVAAYARGGAGEHRGPHWLVKRNHSILAHGFVSVDQPAWEEAKVWIEMHLLGFCGGAMFPQLPRQIPPLQSVAV
jgi:CRISPR-associated protein (TIGR02710 family)